MTVIVMKMLAILISILGLLGPVLGNGEFVVFHSPPSVKFISGPKPLPAELVPDVISATLGFSTSGDSTWPGLARLSPFNSARVAVIYSLDGPSARLPGEVITRVSNIARYPLAPEAGQGPGAWWATLKHSTMQRSMLNATATHIVLDKKPIEGETEGLDIGSLNPSVDEDRAWLREMQSLRILLKEASSGEFCAAGKGPSVVWLESTALHALSDLHGAGSTQAKDASKMLGSVLAGLSEELQSTCGDRVMFGAVTSDASHTRRTRSLLQSNSKAESDEHNLAKEYNENYPVMFNIFLFFGVGFLFSLIAAAMAIATMDPGRDSIIYRMTNTRMKKDN